MTRQWFTLAVMGRSWSVDGKMTKVNIKCVCGEVFQPDIDLEKYKSELERTGLVPLLLSHKDHFVTAYIDSNGAVRGVEKILLVEDDVTTQVAVEDINLEEIRQTVAALEKEVDPNEDFRRYVSLLLFKVKSSEALFVAGEITGRQMWMKWRESILQLGARYVPQLGLIIESELKPILDKSGDVSLHGDQEILITNCPAPQFVVGIAQGVLNAVSSASKREITIKVEYSIEGNSVMLTVVGQSRLL